MMRATMKKSLRSMVLKALGPGNSRAKRSRETIPEIRNEDPVCGSVEPEVLGTEPETRIRTITLKQERLLVISQLRSVEGWCQECHATVPRLSQKQAATVAAVSEGEIFRQVEAGRLHCVGTNEGGGLICLNSLLKQDIEEWDTHLSIQPR